MSIVFLIGGTGNQLFEYASSDEKDVFSKFFILKNIRNILGWTNHDQIFLFHSPNFLHHIFGIFILVLDCVSSKLLNISMFTEFDTRKIRMEPRLVKLVRLGYFQQAPEKRNPAALLNQVEQVPEPCTVILHVRGGDLLASDSSNQNGYGKFQDAYYQMGIETAAAEMESEGRRLDRILVLTDDLEYATTLQLAVPGLPIPEIRKYSLGETLARAVGAGWFVSSNSTLAYWIVRFREGARCVAPIPFQKRHDFKLPLATRRISVGYN